MPTRSKRALHDLVLILLSVGIAVLLFEHDAIGLLPKDSPLLTYIWSVIVGIFFTSILTIAPASVAFAELAPHGTIWGIAACGALGAMVGDILILSFLKDHVAADVQHYVSFPRKQRFKRIFKHRFTRWVLAFVGALIIASPLPDELGLAMMGLSRVSLAVLGPVSFVMNFIGVYGIVWLALILQ